MKARISLFVLLVSMGCHIALGEYMIDGAKLVPLTDDGKSRAVAWAYHGDWVVCYWEVSNTQGQLMIMKSDGSGKEKISPIGNPFYAEWSWKGDKIAYLFTNSRDAQSQGQVYVYDLAKKQSMAISAPYPRTSFETDDGPVWSADDRLIAYKVYVGPSRTPQFWIADTTTDKSIQLLPERQFRDPQWCLTEPTRLAGLINASGDGVDIAVIGADGKNLVGLTDIGAQAFYNDRPRWSPDGQWVAFKSDMEMTKTEHEKRVEDCWIVRPDGAGLRNLTKASSPSTEKQLDLYSLAWTWDGKWILSRGSRFDTMGNMIATYYKIDPINGGYSILRTSQPQETGHYEAYRSSKVSYDGTKLAYIVKRMTVRNWGPEPQFENAHWVLGIYDLASDKDQDVLVFSEQQDRKEIMADYDIERYMIQNISWSPDSRSILLTVADIISDDDDIMEPDVYRLDLPESLVEYAASRIDGPMPGREGVLPAAAGIPSAESPAASAAGSTTKANGNGLSVARENHPAISEPADWITRTVTPQHMTADEALQSLPDEYAQYITVNKTRNLFLYKGPGAKLETLLRDLEMIDTQPRHILVDLLAVELSDEANRSLGLDWTYAQGHFGFFQPEGNAIRDLTPDPGLGGMTTFPGAGQIFFNGVDQLPQEFFIRLNALIQDGKATVLANPRTVATSGKKSLIQIRKTVNYFFNEGYDVSGRPIVKKSDISSDTMGDITPTLLQDGRIHLIVDVGVGTFSFSENEGGLPEQTSRKSTTEVTVQQGQTIVIGGLRQQETSMVKTKVPLLGDIPILGFFFSKEEEQVKHSVLTIFITPQELVEGKPTPEWPKVDVEDAKLVPIMQEEELTD